MYAAHEGHLDMLQLLLQYGMPAAEVMCGVTVTCCIGACDWSLSTALMDLIAICMPSLRLAIGGSLRSTVLHWVIKRPVSRHCCSTLLVPGLKLGQIRAMR